MSFIDDLNDKVSAFHKSQDDSGMGTLPGLAKMLKGPVTDEGTGKIPLTLLPPGIQAGQRVSLTVTGIDPVTGMATVVPDAVQEAVPPAPGLMGASPKKDIVDRELTMGPMDNLKSYLFQKTQDQEEQE